MAFQNVTLATLQTYLSQRYDGQPFWTADQARRAINEGLRIWNVITGAWRASPSISLQTVPNDPYLPVGETVEKVTQVKIGTRTLNQASIFGLDDFFPGWEGMTTQTPGVSPSPRYWAPVGLTEIALFPADAIVNGVPFSSTLTVDGIVAAPILVNAGDLINLGSEEINTLLGYALHVLSFSKGITALQATRPLYLAFFKAAAARNAIFAASSLYRKIIGRDFLRTSAPMVSAESSASAEPLLSTKEPSSGGN